MNNILHVLFVDNPGLTSELSQFCEAIPGLNQKEQELDQLLEEGKRLLDRSFYIRLEDAIFSFASEQA